MDCAICLKECVFPASLPCKHIFCFLCIKGAISKRFSCPICRANVPVDYFDNPNLINKPEQAQAPIFDENYSWFYAGANGWWVYDEQHSSEIEECYKNGVKQLELLIAGHLYIIDLDKMVQYRKRDQRRLRKIKRDLTSNAPAKGIAGIKLNLTNNSETVSSND